MKKISILLLALAMSAPVFAAGMMRAPQSSSDGPLTFAVDSIDCRADLTRVYGRLLGNPHTSGRIDKVTLSSGKNVHCDFTDIDPVEAGKYYQFEDEGVILLEIDFPAVKSDLASGTLLFATPHGDAMTTWLGGTTAKAPRKCILKKKGK